MDFCVFVVSIRSSIVVSSSVMVPLAIRILCVVAANKRGALISHVSHYHVRHLSVTSIF
ncbi:unnamed protein product [Prunus brigantina]